MFNVFFAERYAEARQKEMLKWAEQERLFQEARRSSREKQSLFWGLGQMMIVVGCWLQARQKPIL
jgi:gamma-glutamylcysteine synthetase